MVTRIKSLIIFLITGLTFILIGIVMAVAKVDKEEIINEPVQLIGNFKSYQDFNNVKLLVDLYWPDKVFESTVDGFNNSTCDVSEYLLKSISHEKINGDLRLVFIKDQLMETIFYPEDFHKYRDILIKKFSLVLRKQGNSDLDFQYEVASVSPNLEIWFSGSKVYNGRPTVIWRDIRLSKVLDICIETKA